MLHITTLHTYKVYNAIILLHLVECSMHGKFAERASESGEENKDDISPHIIKH